MNEVNRLIFKIELLKKVHGSIEAINIKKLEIHPGTIYALVGPPGSGKTTLLNILSGKEKQDSGNLYFESNPYKRNFFGKIIKPEEIFYNHGYEYYDSSLSIGNIITKLYGKKSNIFRTQSVDFPHSIGLLYSAFTEFLGFEVNEGEFKVMSLSSFGKPRYETELKKIFNIDDFKIEIDYFEFHKNLNKSFSKKLSDMFGEPYLNINEESNFKKYADIACSAQSILEQAMQNVIKKVIKMSGKTKIVLTGGVALNCKMIHNLSKLDIFEELVVPPSPGDSGSAIGAANFAYLNQTKNKTLNLNTILLGPKKEIINERINKDNLFSKISSSDTFIQDATNKLIKGEIIASYYGLTEVGPRSLGNTSILCDAKNTEAVNNLNLKIKKREHYQPLAPIVLEEDFEKYFYVNKSIKKNLEWMGCLCDANQKLHENYKSIIHIDGTSRTQLIKDKDTITFKILKELKKKGSDILVNTSFNISKDPVVFDLFDVFVNMKRLNIKFVLMDDGLYQTKNI